MQRLLRGEQATEAENTAGKKYLTRRDEEKGWIWPTAIRAPATEFLDDAHLLAERTQAEMRLHRHPRMGYERRLREQRADRPCPDRPPHEHVAQELDATGENREDADIPNSGGSCMIGQGLLERWR